MDSHVARQIRCPYLDQNKPSCGCDKDIHVDIAQPTVRFNKFNDSSLDFAIIVYVRDYGSQFKMKSDMRVISCMKNLKNMILEFHGQLELSTKEMKRGKRRDCRI